MGSKSHQLASQRRRRYGGSAGPSRFPITANVYSFDPLTAAAMGNDLRHEQSGFLFVTAIPAGAIALLPGRAD